MVSVFYLTHALQGIAFTRLQHHDFGARFFLDPLSPCVLILREQIEGVVMDRNHNLWFQKFDGPQRIIGSHSVIIPNGNDRQIKPFFTN
jgi:hypothetical protein